ncbi:MAG TPA: TRAP transporter substrate-binding protein [Burkholderiales bacterium]
MRKRFVYFGGNRMKTRVLAALCLLAGVVLAVTTAQAQVVELKLSSWVPPKHPLNADGFPLWAKSIEAESKGTLKVTIFPAQQLGQAKDHYDMARDGIADFTYVNPGYTPGRFPIIAGGELPFLFSNAKDGSKALDEWYRPYAKTEMKDVHYCFAYVHDPGTLHAKKEIKRPDQLKGMKIRPANGTIANLVALNGGASVQVSAPEAREALETGVADAITFPWNSIYLFGIDRSVKFHMDAPFYVTTFVHVMSPGTYAKLNANQKKVIDNHCTSDWAKKVAEGWATWESEGRTKMMADKGHTVYSLSADDVKAWRASAKPLRDEWAASVKKAGGDPDKAMSGLESTLKKFNSAY